MTYAVTAAVIIAGLCALCAWTPQCHPGDPAVYIGGILVQGCK